MSKKSYDDHIKKNPTSDPYHSFLQSLKGKQVTIYRGGPESKSGVLLDVQQDYVTVYAQNNNNNNNNQNNAQNNNNNQNNQNTVVYYNIRHIASISENSVNNSTLNLQQQLSTENPEFVQADSFTGVARHLKDKYIQINQGGPEKKTGLVLDVVDDYVVLFAEDDGVVYFNVNHVKSISEYNQNNNQNEDGEDNTQNQMVLPEFEKTATFHDLFGRMAHKWIAINRGGPEAMEGILVENAGGHYTLINNQEVMRINPYHIKSISSGPKGALKQNNQNNQQDNEEQKNAEAENCSKDNHSEKTTSSSSRSTYSRRTHRERVVKSIDYVWRAR